MLGRKSNNLENFKSGKIIRTFKEMRPPRRFFFALNLKYKMFIENKFVGLKKFCSFETQSRLRRNPKTIFFNYKELPVMGNKSERLVYPFLERDCNPKMGDSAYKIIFQMQSGNQFVENSEYAISTQQLQVLLNSIKDFFDNTEPSQIIQSQNDLCFSFFTHEKERLDKVKDNILLSGLQNQFITSLFEQFQSINKIKNVA